MCTINNILNYKVTISFFKYISVPFIVNYQFIKYNKGSGSYSSNDTYKCYYNIFYYIVYTKIYNSYDFYTTKYIVTISKYICFFF